MAAEQALIEENKKDPRIRYITQDHDNNVEFWQNTPSFNTEFNEWTGSLIFGIIRCKHIEFKQEECFERILCIDDIKIPTIPTEWVEERNELIEKIKNL